MSGALLRAAVSRPLAALFVVALIGGCGPADPLGRSGVALEVPPGWRPVASETWPVPGTPLAAWSGPGGASLVVYRDLPDPGGDAASIVEGLANRLENLPGLTVLRRGGERAGGAVGSLIEVSAPGFGDALAPTGVGTPVAVGGKALRPTRRKVVVFPRAGDTVALVWHAPESDAAALDSAAARTLRSLRLGPSAVASQSY